MKQKLTGVMRMRQIQQFSIIIEPVKEAPASTETQQATDGAQHYQAECPELELSTYGATAEKARAKLIEAIELFFQLADASEISTRLNRHQQPIRLSFWLEDDPDDGYRAIALGEAGIIQDEVFEALCESLHHP
ncbi:MULTISPECIES: hypothetical protein [unclassified Leptolyngbya]|uniref:type II toxin-antitoxin system HicB family antitoxin n=1 Tax=unclassified Leptolyngbya TaxID=2650499 RepID=UPI0018F01711|nr:MULTISPECIES: hypothetical protein [unclassified Leptolyngbya]